MLQREALAHSPGLVLLHPVPGVQHACGHESGVVATLHRID